MLHRRWNWAARACAARSAHCSISSGKSTFNPINTVTNYCRRGIFAALTCAPQVAHRVEDVVAVVVEDDGEVDEDGDERPLQHRGTVERLQRRREVGPTALPRHPVPPGGRQPRGRRTRRDLVGDYPDRRGTGAAASAPPAPEVAGDEGRGARDDHLDGAPAAVRTLVDEQSRRQGA